MVPKCMGGSDHSDNLVKLLPEEHYIAHLLLAKIHPNVPGLWGAVAWMSTGHPKRSMNKVHGWVRRSIAAATAERSKKWHAENVHPMLGKKQTPETKKAISTAAKNYGVSVHQYDATSLEFLRSFKSLNEAAVAINRSPQTIYAACTKANRTAGGFKFSYVKSSVYPGTGTSTRARFTCSNKHKRGLVNRAPWEVLAARGRSDLLKIWALAPIISQLLKDGQDARISQDLKLNAHVVRKIKNKIKSGWDPATDERWVKYFSASA